MATRGDVVSTLQELGLTENEGKVLLAIHRLGSAKARELAKASGVARSQVYGIADELETLGFVHVQQANPKEYSAATTDETRELFLTRFDRRLEEVVGYLEELEADRAQPQETREDIWTIRGKEAIDRRVERLLADAESRVLLGVSAESMLSETMIGSIRSQSQGGVDITVISRDEAVRARFEDIDDVLAVEPPEHISDSDREGRLLMIDDTTILHSVEYGPNTSGNVEETAVWSANSGFAEMFISMIEPVLGSIGPT